MAKQGVITEKDDDDDQTSNGQVTIEKDEADDKGKKDEVGEVVVEQPDKDDGDEDSHLDVGGELDDQEHERRETSKERRERAKRAKERDRGELRLQKALIDQLQNQISQLTVQTAETRVSTLDAQIASAQAEAQRFQQIQAAAIKAQNGEDAVAAAKYVSDAEALAQRLTADKERLLQAVKAVPQHQQRQEVAWAEQARKFVSDKPWYDSNGRDQDSLVVTAIDRALIQERFDPRTEDYWEELEARTRKMLPHRFSKRKAVDDQDDNDDVDDVATTTRTRRGPPVGGGRSSQGKPGTIVLSKDRVEALKAAGLWDDPKTRYKMAVKYFGEWDKTNAAANRRG